MKKRFNMFSLLIAIAVLLSACGGSAQTEITSSDSTTGKVVEYSLMTNMVDGQMAFFGVGGDIDGMKNPTLSADVGDLVKVTLTSGDGVEHDVAFPDSNVQSEHFLEKKIQPHWNSYQTDPANSRITVSWLGIGKLA